MTYQTEGIILSRSNYRDADRLLRVLSRDRGLLTLRAISVRKSRAKLIGHTEPLLHTALFVAQSRGIDILAGSQQITAFTQLRQSWQTASAAQFIVGVIDRSLAAEDPHPELFTELFQWLQWLDAQTIEPHALLVPTMLLRIAMHTGYEPQLTDCLQCKRSLQAELQQWFQADSWSVLCADCGQRQRTAHMVALSPTSLTLLQFIDRVDLDQITRRIVSVDDRVQLYRLLYRVLYYHLPTNAQALAHHYTLLYPQR